PTGLSLSTSGTITGTPSVSGSFTGTVTATDANGCTGSLAYTIPVRTFSIGNLIFEDSNNNGLKDGVEPGVAATTVQLFSTGSDNAIGGTSTAADTQIGSNFTTTSTGAYLFTGLIAGNYYVKVTPPVNYRYSGGTPATSDNNVNDNNDGAQPGGLGTPLYSPVINLSPGAESATDGDTNTDTNLTLDFGLWSPLGVGNLVFLDYNGNGNYDDSEGIEGVYVQIFAQGANVATDSPANVALTDHKGRYYIDGLNPGSYFLHLPASQFATGAALSGMVPMSSVVAGDDDTGQDLLPAATPATTGSSTAVFTLNVGLLPTGASESGFEGVADDSFVDANNDFTRDLGLRSASGGGFPLAMRERVTITENSAANTFTAWQTTHANAEDHDLYPALLEYALDTDPANGSSGAGKFRVIVNDTTGAADVLLSRPAAGHEDIIYTVEVSADLKTWTRLAILPQTSIAADGSQIVRYASLEDSTVFAGQSRGFVRLKIALDADLNGVPEDTAVSPVQAFSRENFSIGQRSFSMPLVKAELFAGNISAMEGNALVLPVSVTLPAAQLYIQDLITGINYEVDELASTSTRIALIAESIPALSRIALRAHHTLVELLPADLFTSGTTEAEADRIMTFDPASNAFQVTWLSSTGWTRDSANVGSELLPPQSAVLVHARSAEVSVLLTGQLANSAALQASSSTRLISTGLSITQSPEAAGFTVAKGYRAASSASAASRLRLWKADSDASASGYDNLFLMQTDTAAIWVREEAATQTDLSQEPLLEPFHGFFLVP
ncbi:MAG: SdrD B-like domain-containing protein, partial [Prosthecobacter sp.]